MTGIYIHVPFCERKCPYCAFYSGKVSAAGVCAYMEALKRNIISFPDAVKADTLYFGGGTPALLGTDNIAEIIALCRERFTLDDAEITLETNPNSTDREMLERLRTAGVNRLSIGVQSLNDTELSFLGRLHNARQAEDALRLASEADFENISADLMIGIKGQTPDSLRDSVARLSSLGAVHISAYMISVEPGTPFDRDEVRDKLMDENDIAELYISLMESCKDFGLEQYEISNFASADLVSRHNMKYWQGDDYLGFGPSAHSFYKGVRYYVPKDLTLFISSDRQPEIVSDPEPDRAEEYIMLGLRLSKGISLEKAASLGVPAEKLRYIETRAELCKKNGLCTFDNGIIALTPRGMLVSNSIITSFLA